jgi:hypothetical protein
LAHQIGILLTTPVLQLDLLLRRQLGDTPNRAQPRLRKQCLGHFRPSTQLHPHYPRRLHPHHPLRDPLQGHEVPPHLHLRHVPRCGNLLRHHQADLEQAANRLQRHLRHRTVRALDDASRLRAIHRAPRLPLDGDRPGLLRPRHRRRLRLRRHRRHHWRVPQLALRGRRRLGRHRRGAARVLGRGSADLDCGGGRRARSRGDAGGVGGGDGREPLVVCACVPVGVGQRDSVCGAGVDCGGVLEGREGVDDGEGGGDCGAGPRG